MRRSRRADAGPPRGQRPGSQPPAQGVSPSGKTASGDTPRASPRASGDASGDTPRGGDRRALWRPLAVGALAGLIVVVTLLPADSIEVERGAALALVPLALLALVAARRTPPQPIAAGEGQRLEGPPRRWRRNGAGEGGGERSGAGGGDGWLLEGLLWGLAGWIAVAAVATAEVGNVRAAVNECWWWVTAAAVLSSARRLARDRRVATALVALLLAAATLLAVHAAHQQLISLPRDRAAYERDPEATLRQLDFDAAEGSAQRMLLESRLYHGGPTASFALANSLAAPLAMSFVIAVALLIQGAVRRVGWPAPTLLAIVAVACAAGLIWTASRSALLAVAAAFTMGAIWRVLATARGRRHDRYTAVGLAAGLGLLSTALAAVAWRGDLLSGAPRSILFRLQYWRSTLEMVRDAPLWGVGPGNFRSVYPTYRADSANELVADPHNLLMETLAAGGVPAGLLLLAFWGVGAALVLRRRPLRTPALEAPEPSPPAVSSPPAASPWRAIMLGAAAGFVFAGAMGLIEGSFPDLEAYLVAVPAAVAVLGLLGTAARRGWLATEGGLRTAAALAVLAAAIHLLAAGGWTVPGIAVPLLVLMGIATASPTAIPEATGGAARAAPLGPSPREALRRSPGATTVAAALLLLAAWYFTAWWPVSQAARWNATASYQWGEGQLPAVSESLEQAVRADPWDAESALRWADTLRWRLVLEGESPELRRSYDSAAAAAQQRDRRNPIVLGTLAEQRIHLYQRWGAASDREAAAGALQEALERFPSSPQLLAQAAVLRAAQGDPQGAGRLAQRAAVLAQLGDHADRQLNVTLLAVPDHVGPPAEEGVQRKSASVMLANLLEGSDVAPPGVPRAP